MQRIVLHHTGGALNPSPYDKKFYHRLIDGEGVVHAGLHPISANAPGTKLLPGKYAAHCRGLNTGAIGISMACMANAVWDDPRGCRSFPTAAQTASVIVETARLCREYNISVTRKTVLSHAEVQTTLGIAQAGKWDFDYDPFGILDTRDPIRIGDMLREKVSEAMGGIEPAAPRGPMPVIRRGSRGEAVAIMQRALSIQPTDGMFGPATELVVIAFQRRNQLLPDGIVGRATWAALNI